MTVVQLAEFELRLTAIDAPTTQRRHDGSPFPSQEARDAMRDAAEAFQQAVRDAGLQIVHTGYGVSAREIEPRER